MTSWNVPSTGHPQEVIDYASSGDTLVFPNVVYELLAKQNNSLLYTPKPLIFDMSAGTILRAAAGQTSLLPAPEKAVGKYAAFVGLDDLTPSFITPLDPSLYNKTSSVLVTIDGVGSPNTFSLSIDGAAPYATLVPITGAVQDVSFQNMGIQFASLTGHSLGDVWYVYPTTTVVHGIRIGRGFQTDWIDGTQVIGGTIDPQYPLTNIKPHNSAADIAGCIFLNGRVRNTVIRNPKFVNYDRQIFTQTEVSGANLNYGLVSPGISFDHEFLTVSGVQDQTYTAYHLLGHPSHRGQTRFASFVGSDIYGVEPNFRCHQFESQRNYFNNAAGIDMWRGPKMQIIEDNISTVSGPTFNPHSPTGWPTTFSSKRRNNILSVAATPVLAPWTNTFPAGWTQRAVLSLPVSGTRVAVFNATIIAYLQGVTLAGGADLRASYDVGGAQPIPIDRVTDDSGVLVGFYLGVFTQISSIYLWWGKAGEVAPPRTDIYHGGWRALFPQTIVDLPGDFATNTILAARDTTTGARLGKAQTFSLSQSEVYENCFDGDTRLMSQGFYFGCFVTASTGGMLFSYGSATLYLTATSIRASFSNIVLTTSYIAGSHIGYRVTLTTFELLVNGVVVTSSPVTSRIQFVVATVFRLGSTIQNNATNGFSGTIDEVMICRVAPTLEQIQNYVTAVNFQSSLVLQAPTTV